LWFYLDDFNLEVLWIEVDNSLPAEGLVHILDTLIAWRDSPVQIRMDNGPELISHKLESWAREHHTTLAYIQPGKPVQNAHIERFNRTFREDILDAYLFSLLEEVRQIVEPWIEEYNLVRPHEALRGLSPYQFAKQNTGSFLLSFGTKNGMLTDPTILTVKDSYPIKPIFPIRES